jgi:hypothetical protein
MFRWLADIERTLGREVDGISRESSIRETVSSLGDFLLFSFAFSSKICYNTHILARRLTKALRRGKFRPESQVKLVTECRNQDSDKEIL